MNKKEKSECNKKYYERNKEKIKKLKHLRLSNKEQIKFEEIYGRAGSENELFQFKKYYFNSPKSLMMTAREIKNFHLKFPRRTVNPYGKNRIKSY